MKRIHSSFDTRPFWSVSINFNICRAHVAPAATPRSLTAKAGVDAAPATSAIAIKVTFAILNMIFSRVVERALMIGNCSSSLRLVKTVQAKPMRLSAILRESRYRTYIKTLFSASALRHAGQRIESMPRTSFRSFGLHLLPQRRVRSLTGPTCKVTIPIHNTDLKRGTLRGIIAQAGLTVQEFIELL